MSTVDYIDEIFLAKIFSEIENFNFEFIGITPFDDMICHTKKQFVISLNVDGKFVFLEVWLDSNNKYKMNVSVQTKKLYSVNLDKGVLLCKKDNICCPFSYENILSKIVYIQNTCSQFIRDFYIVYVPARKVYEYFYTFKFSIPKVCFFD